MNEETVEEKLNVIFQNVFDRLDETFNRDSAAFDIEEWDSLSHIRLMMAVEKEFRIRIASSEFEHLDGFGTIVDMILKKIR